MKIQNPHDRYLLALLNTLITGLALLFLIPPSATAMPLEDYVSDTILAHPAIREQIHVYRQVEKDRDIAKSGWHPSIDLTASTGTYETESPATGQVNREYESNRAELSVTQNLFNGFETQNQVEQTSARMQSALNEIIDTADNIALQATQAYLDLLKQKRLVELAEINVNSHERILSQIRERNESGVGRRSELQQTEGRVARAHASMIAQQNNMQDAATRLHELLGRYVNIKNVVEPTLPEHPGKLLDELIDYALTNHPAMQVASYNIQAAQADADRAERNNYPKLDLRLAKQVGEDINGLVGDTDELSLVLNMSYNFYRGGADRAEQRKKVSAVHQNQAFAANVRRQVINTLRLAWAADLSLARQLKYLTTHIEKARETVVSYGEEFFIGQRDLLDLLDAESELNSAQNQHATAYYDLMAARFRIMEAIGDLFPAMGMKIEMAGDELRIDRVLAHGTDELPLVTDHDLDNEQDTSDHCDNTLKHRSVNDYGCHNSQTLDFGFTQMNQPPFVMDDQLSLEMDSVLAIPQKVLLENDGDADGDPVRLIDFTQPQNGNIAFDDLKNLIYRANPGYVGRDSFTYTITDGHGAVATAKVFLEITRAAVLELSKTQYVNYIYKKTKLTPESEARVEDIIGQLKAFEYEMIEVFAYTDNIGSDSYNLALSKRRAKATREMLISHGLDADRIRAVGMGENNPIADNATAEGQAINRRGEIRVKLGTSKNKQPQALLLRQNN